MRHLAAIFATALVTTVACTSASETVPDRAPVAAAPTAAATTGAKPDVRLKCNPQALNRAGFRIGCGARTRVGAADAGKHIEFEFSIGDAF